MTVRSSERAWVPVTMARWLAAIDVTAVLMGVVAAVGVLALIGTALIAGVAGIDIFEASNLERLAASTVAIAIGLVFAAFFCGGWAYGALRGRAKRGRLGDVRYGEPDVRDPVRWAGADTGPGATTDDGISLNRDGQHQAESKVKQLWRNLTYGDLDVAARDFDEFVGRIR